MVYYVLNTEIIGDKKVYSRIPEYYTVHVTDPLGYGVAGIPVVVLVSNGTMEYIGGAGYTDSYGIAYIIVTLLFSGNYTLTPSTLMKYTIINSASIDVEVERIDTRVPSSVNASLSNIYLALSDLNKTVREGFNSINGDLGELRDLLLVLDSKLDIVNTTLHNGFISIETRIDSLEGSLSNQITSLYVFVNESMEDVLAKLDGISGEVEGVGSNLSTIIAVLVGLSDEIDVVNTSISNGFLVVESKLDVIGGKVDETYTLLFKVNDSLANVFTQLNILKLGHNDINNRLDTIADMLANISSLSSEISGLRDLLAGLTSDLENIVESMDEYRGLLIGVSENLTLLLGLIEDMDTLKHVVDEVRETTLEMNISIGERVTRIETNTATILTKTSDILENVDVLDDGQTRIETSIGEITGEIKEVKDNVAVITTSLGELKIDLENVKQEVIKKLEELGYIEVTTSTTSEQGIAPELVYTVVAIIAITIGLVYTIVTRTRIRKTQ